MPITRIVGGSDGISPPQMINYRSERVIAQSETIVEVVGFPIKKYHHIAVRFCLSDVQII